MLLYMDPPDSPQPLMLALPVDLDRYTVAYTHSVLAVTV